MCMDIFDTGLFQIAQCSVQSVDARNVLGARLKLVRHKFRLEFRIGNTSCTAGHQWDHLMSDLVAYQESADSLWTQQALVSGECQNIDVHLLHINRKGTCCLCSIHNEFEIVFVADIAHFLKRHNGTADVGSVQHHDCLGVWTDHFFDLVHHQLAVTGAWDAVKLHTQLFYLLQRTHHGIVLHRGNQYMISRAQIALDNVV